MSRFGLVLTALLLSTLGSSPYTGDCPTKDGPDCVDCWNDFPEVFCDIGYGEPECHMTDHVGDPEWDTWDFECQNGPHDDVGDGFGMAGGSCAETHEWVPNCYKDQEDPLAKAVDEIEKAVTFGEASRTLRAFQDIKGVWIEFNAERNALQILSDGACNPVPGGKVIKHLPVTETQVDLWKAVLTNQ